MGVLSSLRQFHRERDGVTVVLRPDEWPADVPLPAGSTVVGVGENHELLIYPQWRFVLEPNCTVELVTGWFKTSISLDAALNWYRTELAKWGWVQDTNRGYLNSNRAGLRFLNSDGKAHVSISVQWWPSLDHTTAMIWRVTKHPWSPADELAAKTEVPSLPAEPT